MIFTIFRVYSNKGDGVNERCLKNRNGDFIGVKSGEIYSSKDYYSSELKIAEIIAIDKKNNTGMYHLDEKENFEKRKKYIGAIITVREAHSYGSKKVYQCLELDEYFSDTELKIIKR